MTHSFTTWECTGHGQRWEWNITAWWISFIIHRVNMEWHKWLNDDISQCSTFIKSIKCLLHNSQWNETTFNCNLMHLPFERKFRDMLPCSLKWKYHKKRSRIRESGFRGRRWAIPIKMKEIWWETIRIIRNQKKLFGCRLVLSVMSTITYFKDLEPLWLGYIWIDAQSWNYFISIDE